ncbi:hypothetical protein PHYPSEUDO_003561 [Phytophthora pseudosyringae]|uniref:Uncharacterized protein n=1 Tax=Phytophthora pseudosyringae TaxID=221518 RepID=A0A8T1VUF5_9STRA|nr:hypothetical protein PHYPSEUDO_003561 [Phytophthora pseudosyringae]
MAKLKNTRGTSCKQRTLKARARDCGTDLLFSRALLDSEQRADVHEIEREAVHLEPAYEDNSSSIAASSKERPAAKTLMLVATDRASHARSVEAKKYAPISKAVRALRVQQAVYARSCKPYKQQEQSKLQ